MVWREIWDQVAPARGLGHARNEGTYDEALLLIMERNGYPEETYYTFSYSPVPERRRRHRRHLLRQHRRHRAHHRRAAARAAARAGGAHRRRADRRRRLRCGAPRRCATSPRDLPFALIYLLDDRAAGRSSWWATPASTGRDGLAPDVVRLGEASPWPFAEALATGEPVEVGRDRLPPDLPDRRLDRAARSG